MHVYKKNYPVSHGTQIQDIVPGVQLIADNEALEILLNHEMFKPYVSADEQPPRGYHNLEHYITSGAVAAEPDIPHDRLAKVVKFAYEMDALMVRAGIRTADATDIRLMIAVERLTYIAGLKAALNNCECKNDSYFIAGLRILCPENLNVFDIPNAAFNEEELRKRKIQIGEYRIALIDKMLAFFALESSVSPSNQIESRYS